MRRLVWFLVAAAACRTADPPAGPGADASASAGASAPPPPMMDAAPPVDARVSLPATVVALDGAHVYFGPDNRRELEVELDFPDAVERYGRVTLDFALRCPDGGCDWWDRLGWLSIVEPGGDPGQPDQLEVLRFITPYRVGGAWSVDVTDLRPLLSGRRTLRVFIDTWVGPGHANGAGWLVDAAFHFEPGTPEREAIAVVGVWGPHWRVYGDPARPIAASKSVELPPDATEVRLRAFVTGHGQGNADNCAEFCARDHYFQLADTSHTRHVWRDDCETTAVPGQHGTWQYPRAGWCPGATVHPLEVDAAATSPATIGYDVQPYDNTCRPDAPVCTGCVFGTGCNYDGGAHTEPSYVVSAAVIAYR